MTVGDEVVLASAAKSAAYTMIIQGMFRIGTFAMNSVLLHHITRDMLGVANVRLVLLNQTILFLTFEAFRRACLSKTVDRCWSQIVNLLWFVVPIGIFWTSLCGILWLFVWERPDPTVVPFYDSAIYWYCLASFIEIIVQPLSIVAQILLYVELKAVIEGVTLVFRCVTVVLLTLFFPEFGLKSFCYAQLMYASLMLVMYLIYFVRHISANNGTVDFPFKQVRDLFPRLIPGKPYIGADLSWLVCSFFFQSILKHFLTEGEKIVMTVLRVVSFADQGVFEVVSNLGSLPARMLFLPIEDALYLFFTKTLNRGQWAVHQQSESVQLSDKVLESTLKICVLIGMVFITFGYSYSFLLLDLYGGRILSEGSGPMLLRWYCAYVLLTAMNGVTEGFKNATMSDNQLNRFSRSMILFTVVSVATSWVFTLHFGSVGLIWSNCINMALRTAHSIHYIRHFYSGSGYSPHMALVPRWPVIASFITVAFVMAVSEAYFCCEFGVIWDGVHVFVGSLCLLAVGISVFVFDKKLVKSLRTEIYPLLFRNKAKHT